MTTISTELGLIVFIVAFFGLYTFISSLSGFPSSIKFISPFSTAFFTVGIPAIAGACTVATGLPCAVAINVYAVANLLIAYYSTNTLISLIIITPAMIGVIYAVSKLARGGG
jgi:hypothetical protein